MLLRRITKHVKDQNWFAVGLDFLIVVFGVFIGIQVSNWNEEQGRKSQERSHLVLLNEELTQNAERSALLLEYYTSVTGAGERALDFLKSDEECKGNCEDLLIDFFHASQLWAVSFDQIAFREAIDLGFPSDNDLREELSATYNLTSSFGVINQTSPPFREKVREYFETDAARILWGGCWEVDVAAVTERLMRDCADQLKTVDASGMLQSIKGDPDLEGMLRYSLNQNIIAMLNYPVMRDRTIAMADMIATEIETAR